jgi:hypothetical protein
MIILGEKLRVRVVVKKRRLMEAILTVLFESWKED